MENNSYNLDDEKFKKEIDLLKSLPKLNTPKSFEYNLMSKIKNQNFDTRLTENKHSKLIWTFAPAGAIVVSAVVLFFVFFDPSLDTENPFMIEPKLRTDLFEAEFKSEPAQDIVSEEAGITKPSIRDDSKRLAKKEFKSKSNEEEYRVVLRSNDVVSKEKVEFPFNKDENVNLDKVFSASPATNERMVGSRLASGKEDGFDFDGFYIREYQSKKKIDINSTTTAKKDTVDRKAEKLP